MNRLLDIFNRLFVLWITAATVLAFVQPAPFIAMRSYMELFFAITMFGIGMVLDPSDFLEIFKNAKAVIVGVAAQFSIMPLLAFVISSIFAFPKEFSLGLILAGSAPGAMASNVLSYLAGADVAYSVSLTTVSTLLAPVLTPFLTLILAHTLLEIPFQDMVFSVSKMVLLPLLLGLGLRRILGQRIARISKLFPAISTTFIAFICGVVIALNKAFILKMDAWIFLAVLLLNLAGLTLGYLIGSIFDFAKLRKRALSIEIGMQNAGLGSVLALKHFDEKTALPAVIFVFVCIFTASILVPIWSKQNKPATVQNGTDLVFEGKPLRKMTDM